MTRILRLGTLAAACALLGACSAVERLEQIGERPPLTPIENPQLRPGYREVQMPMPQSRAQVYQPNSLWASGARSFFKDQRATRIGDILTVRIAIDDSAEVANTSARSRDNSENAGLSNFLGVENRLNSALPGTVDPGSLLDLESQSNSRGTGSVRRNEAIDLTVAAVITQVLPNGNLVIEGRQEVRVNYEVRELLIGGVVRPEDIGNDNTVRHTQIAEARVSYGGRGQITDVQQPRYGQQVLDVLWPF
jgi:flagellar L-ring protein FlgH